MILLTLRFAIRNLARHRRRTAIVGLGIVLGVTAAVIHAGLVAGVRQQLMDHLVLSQFGHVTISAKAEAARASADENPSEPLIREPGPIMKAIGDRLPGAGIAPQLSTLGLAFGARAGTARAAIFGIVPEQDPFLIRDLRSRVGPNPSPLVGGSVWIGSALAEQLDVERGGLVSISAFGPNGDLDMRDFEISEVLRRGAPWQNYFVYLTLEDLQTLMGVGNAVSVLKVRIDTGTRGADASAARLASILATGDQGLRVDTYEKTGQMFLGIIKATEIQAALVEITLLIAIALGVAGAQILSVHERRREIGTMTALGTSRRLIRAIILTEGAILSLAAGVVGAGIGIAVTLVLGVTGFDVNAEAFHWMVGGPQVVPRVDLLRIVVTLAGLVVVTTVAGLYPAERASRLVAVEALRGGSG